MVRKIVLLIILCTAIPAGLVSSEGNPPTWVPTPEKRAKLPWIGGPDEVLIGPDGVATPLGRFLLLRKGTEYCALKFTNTWLGNADYEHYTSYEFYYQGNGSGDLSRNNVKSGRGELFFPGTTVWFGIPMIKEGAKDTIEFGAIKTRWIFTTHVYFSKVELAPTPWTSITEVNVFDPRIRWYGKDFWREGTTVQIDRLWDESTPGGNEK